MADLLLAAPTRPSRLTGRTRTQDGPFLSLARSACAARGVSLTRHPLAGLRAYITSTKHER